MYKSLATIIGEKIHEAYRLSTDVVLTSPSDASHGDLTTNVAMRISKEVGRPPAEIAKKLADAISGVEFVEKAEVAGSGFLNVELTNRARLDSLDGVRAMCRRQEKEDMPLVILEYSQPNIAKPLGVHHLLGTIIGQAVANLYRHMGYNVITWNYIGDWGTQFGKLFVAVQKWGNRKEISEYTLDGLLELYVRFHKEACDKPSLDDDARDAFRRLEGGDSEVVAFWRSVVDISRRSIQKIYDRLHVSFDVTRGESPYKDTMDEIIEEGKSKGVFVEGDNGSLIVEFPEGCNLPVYMILKSDGSTLYSTRDLAQMKYRIKKYSPGSILIFTDIAQKLYFQQLEATCGRLGWDMPEFKNILFGRMSFPDNSMSTRRGNVISLESVLDEAVRRADLMISAHESELTGSDRRELKEMIGVGAVVYAILNQNRKSNMTFTWDKALSLEGNSGPYLQYSHARAKSVLRKAGVSHMRFPVKEVASLSAYELDLVRHMLKFPAALEDARAEAMPHKLTRCIYELCRSFNAFYNAEPIIKSREPQRSLRLALTGLVADVLQTGAEILTMRVPEKM